MQVSSGGACQMRWGRNGEILYVELARQGGAEATPELGPPVATIRVVDGWFE